MGRYTGPKHRVSRRFAENLGGYKKTPLAVKPYKPGQHGRDAKRKKASTYGVGLVEKQKLKFYYQLREKSFRRLFAEALRLPGNTGDSLLQMLERRLDNMVYRSGLAPSPRAARQLVAHGHVTVKRLGEDKFRKVDRASFMVGVGDVISLREKSREHIQVKESIASRPEVVGYLTVDFDKMEATLNAIPKRDDIPVLVNEAAVVEFLGR